MTLVEHVHKLIVIQQTTTNEALTIPFDIYQGRFPESPKALMILSAIGLC